MSEILHTAEHPRCLVWSLLFGVSWLGYKLALGKSITVLKFVSMFSLEQPSIFFLPFISP